MPISKLRDNTLFITFVSAYDGTISSSIRSFLANKITIEQVDFFRSSLDRKKKRLSYNPNKVTNDLYRSLGKEVVLKWLGYGGLTYSGVSIDDSSEDEERVLLEKNIYDKEGRINGKTLMSLRENESAGTNKFYSYIGWIYKKFEEGGLFISDEIDNNFHPSLLRRLINFFNDKEINTANAQLLFTSHDTTLMQPNTLRRDQIYFTEKSSKEESVLYSLSDLKGIRNNADFARQYLAGFYGAIPILEGYREMSNPDLEFKSKPE